MKDSEPTNKLWLEKIAEATKLEWFGSRFLRQGIGPYIYVGIFLFITTFVITPLISGPLHLIKDALGSFFSWTAAFFGIWATKRMNDKFYDVVQKFDFSVGYLSFRLKYILFFGGAIIIVGWILILNSIIPNPITGSYAQTIWRFIPLHILLYAIWIFVYLMIVTEFLFHFVRIHYTPPKKVRKEEPELDYSDLERTGGMKRLGDVLLSSTEYYFIGLTLFTFLPITYRSLVGPGSTILFASGWIFGILMFFVPSFSVHSYIKEKKKDKMKDLRSRIEEAGYEPGGHLEVDPEDPEEREKYLFLYLEHEHLYDMNEYPFDRAILQELALASGVPIVTESLISLFF
ncbi:hypothetical protein AKJ52_01385 [candidate division MSBL1 archaeon SCGC-AAA382C18]|uniref:Uncharacterized protein n=1 Tax=candidate division MSBL1 archaeon SCGC-AAA382C18 TaxID=1698281 RepID=A0A133VK97_9EURY|nr:hypothetical protein AKJ52_01385 [candidate division MSBL1 archaeon SCGC-AAA382C18]